MRQYFLPSHVSFCIDDDAVVFLDLKLDKYRMLRGSDASAFLSLLPKAPVENRSSASEHAPHADQSLPEPKTFNTFLQEGLLTLNAQGSKPIRPTLFEPAAHHLIDDGTPVIPKIRFGDVCIFLVSCVSAAIRLRIQHIDNMVKSVARRKAVHERKFQIDLDRTRHLVATFNRLRGFFPANYLCLFDSLALIEFLAHHGIYPDWIFAVRTEPWGAHCWVQDGSIVFNDGVENIDDCTPILVV